MNSRRERYGAVSPAWKLHNVFFAAGSRPEMSLCVDGTVPLPGAAVVRVEVALACCINAARVGNLVSPRIIRPAESAIRVIRIIRG